jgi:PIN like domain
MEKQFPGFYDRTEEEFSMLWQEATLVLDTNMLLNVYRYREDTRERFIEILEQLKERIWIPHQAIYEYQNNRLEVIGQQLKVYSEVSKALKSAQAPLEGLEYLKEKHRFIKIDEIIEDPIRALAEANKKLSAGQHKGRQEFEKLKASDSYRERITQLFQSRIGDPYKKDQLLDIYRQADKRFELQIPPGWKDKTKKTYGKYGDVILWFQLLEYARVHNKPILFITDDVKSDWFLSAQEGNGKPRPRSELVQEMYVEAGVLLHVYQGYEFFDQATKFLSLKPEPNISEDAKEVSAINSAGELIGLIGKAVVASITGYRVFTALVAWLPDMYPGSELEYGYRSQPDDWLLDLVMTETDGTKTAIDLLPFSDDEDAHDKIMDRIRDLDDITEPIRFKMIIPADNIPHASKIYSVLKNKINANERFSIVIAYVDSYGNFQEYKTVP